jgi:hypothetical protein
MQNLVKSKSFLLFTLIFCSFFSCQQLLDVIKPQPPKPVDETCQLTKKSQGTLGSTRSYLYDSKGRVNKIIYDPNPGDVNPVRFETDTLIYNGSNQIVRQIRESFRSGFERNFEYDSQGRVTKDVTINNRSIEPTVTNEYTYLPDTTKVKTTYDHPLEGITTREYTYVFENDNLVSVLVDSDNIVNTYEYSTTLNKLSPLEKQLAYINGRTIDGRTSFTPFISKNLVSREENPQSGLVTGYTWELNDKGYPTKRSSVNRFGYFEELYEYTCSNK